MNSNLNGMSNGKALLLTIAIMLFIGWLLCLNEPKCKHSGCDHKPKEGSNYCWMHSDNWSSYKSHSTTYDGDRDSYSSVKSTTSYSGSSYSSSGSSAKKKNSSMDSYDEGYEDVYDDCDYDWDRYENDEDYANGVDDAMDDEEEEGW